MQSVKKQSALSYLNGTAVVLGGWVWSLASSSLFSCRGFVTSVIPFASSNYAIGPEQRKKKKR